MKKPIISIVIPTYYGSVHVITLPLISIAQQAVPTELFEVILVDNQGDHSDYIKRIAKEFKARLVTVKGTPSQACIQVNLGVRVAKGKYILILDHDISLGQNFLQSFLLTIYSKNTAVDAWYVPYKIIAKGKFLTTIRNFEEQFYTHSIIAAPRLIKREVFLKTENQYDPILNAGPADWDLTIQLKRMNIKFGKYHEYFYHHEENMDFWQFIMKKTIYAHGGELYKEKWKGKDKKIYNGIIRKQYSPLYRLVGIFIEKGKWKRLIPQMHLYICFLFLKLTMVIVYVWGLRADRVRS